MTTTTAFPRQGPKLPNGAIVKVKRESGVFADNSLTGINGLVCIVSNQDTTHPLLAQVRFALTGRPWLWAFHSEVDIVLNLGDEAWVVGTLDNDHTERVWYSHATYSDYDAKNALLYFTVDGIAGRLVVKPQHVVGSEEVARSLWRTLESQRLKSAPLTNTPTEKEDNMTSISEARRQVEAAEKALADAKAALEKAQALPAEPQGEALIRFSLQYRSDDAKTYSYAALRTNGLWYATSKSRREPMTWEQVVAWIHAAHWHSAVVKTSLDVSRNTILPSGYRD